MEQNTENKARPHKVSMAIKLLYFGLIIGVIGIYADTSSLLAQASLSEVSYFIFFYIAISVFFIHMIGEGKNWARITYLILLIISFPSYFPLQIQLLTTDPYFGIFGIGVTVSQIIAAVFLFQKPSSDWFKLMKSK